MGGTGDQTTEWTQKGDNEPWGFGIDKNLLAYGAGGGATNQTPPEYPELYRDMMFLLLVAGLAVLVVAPLFPLSYSSGPMERVAGWVLGLVLTPCVLLVLYILHSGYVQAMGQGARISKDGLEVQRTVFQRLLTDRPAVYPLSWIAKAHPRRFPTTKREFGEIALTSGDKFLISMRVYQQVIENVPLIKVDENEYRNANPVSPANPPRLLMGRAAMSLAAYIFTGIVISAYVAATFDMKRIQGLVAAVRDWLFVGGGVMCILQSLMSFEFRRTGESAGDDAVFVREKNIYMLSVLFIGLFFVGIWYVMFRVFPP